MKMLESARVDLADFGFFFGQNEIANWLGDTPRSKITFEIWFSAKITQWFKISRKRKLARIKSSRFYTFWAKTIGN